jgi:hypothetical protein
MASAGNPSPPWADTIIGVSPPAARWGPLRATGAPRPHVAAREPLGDAARPLDATGRPLVVDRGGVPFGPQARRAPMWPLANPWGAV